jgi:hypothetical protein
MTTNFLNQRKINMFPYLALFDHEVPVEYPFTQARKVEHLLEFLTKNITETLIKPLKSKEQFIKIKNKKDLFVVFLSSEYNKLAEGIAKNYPQIPMYMTEDKTLAKEIGLLEKGLSFGVFRSYDEGDRFFQYPDGMEYYHFKPIMEKLKWPKIMELSQDTLEHVLLSQENSMIFVPLFTKEEDVRIKDENERSFKEFVKYSSNNTKYKFFKVSKMTPIVEDILFSIGKSHKQRPYVILVSFEIRPYQKYRFEENITKQALHKWSEQFDLGQLTESFKSEPIPEVQDTILQRVVGINFKEEVIDFKGNVMVFLYSMWCAKSKRIIQDLRKIALRAKRWKTQIKWVVFEITRNEAKGLRAMQSYPNLVLYKANDKKFPVWYDGVFDERKLENFTHMVIEGKKKYPDEDL